MNAESSSAGRLTEQDAMALYVMRCRVFWRETDSDDDPRQGWYWVETDETGRDFGDPFGPFESALSAGKNARAAILRRSHRPGCYALQDPPKPCDCDAFRRPLLVRTWGNEMNERLTGYEFKRRTGYWPELDDLARVNCPESGRVGHQQCGWCEQCHGPRFQCSHLAPPLSAHS